MLAGIKVLETITRVTPLGLRFWDEVTGQIISDGLQVTAYPTTNPEKRINAITNRAGAFILHDLPGIHSSEIGTGDEKFWANPPVTRPYAIQVVDMERRFLPFQFEVELPKRDFFTLDCVLDASPPDVTGFLPLFSAPSRAVPGAMAVLRAQLWNYTSNVPASWALLEIHGSGLSLKKGLADQKGRVVIIFPYPELSRSSIGSPPDSSKSLFDQTWELHIKAIYDPPAEVPEIPNLYQIFQQNSATLLTNHSPETPLTQVTLEYGKELVVKSDSHSELYIKTIGSPP